LSNQIVDFISPDEVTAKVGTDPTLSERTLRGACIDALKLPPRHVKEQRRNFHHRVNRDPGNGGDSHLGRDGSLPGAAGLGECSFAVDQQIVGNARTKATHGYASGGPKIAGPRKPEVRARLALPHAGVGDLLKCADSIVGLLALGQDFVGGWRLGREGKARRSNRDQN
jgi:hypothetical protein